MTDQPTLQVSQFLKEHPDFLRRIRSEVRRQRLTSGPRSRREVAVGDSRLRGCVFLSMPVVLDSSHPRTGFTIRKQAGHPRT